MVIRTIPNCIHQCIHSYKHPHLWIQIIINRVLEKKLLTSANTNLEASPSLPLQVINPHDRSIQHDEGRLALNPFCSILPYRAWRTHLRVLFASPEMLEGAPSTDATSIQTGESLLGKLDIKPIQWFSKKFWHVMLPCFKKKTWKKL